jgi:hypothetical protein
MTADPILAHLRHLCARGLRLLRHHEVANDARPPVAVPASAAKADI